MAAECGEVTQRLARVMTDNDEVVTDPECTAIPSSMHHKRPPPLKLKSHGETPLERPLSICRLERKVFRKAVKNQAFEVYVFKRDFYEENGTVEPIDGLLAINPEKDLRGKAIFVRLRADFHHSYPSAAAIIGMQSSLLLHNEVYMLHVSNGSDHGRVDETSSLISGEETSALPLYKLTDASKLQAKLAKTLEWPTVPFRFQLPPHLPSSVVMNQSKGRDHNNEHLGVDYEITVFAAPRSKPKPYRQRCTLHLNIRKLSHIEAPSGVPPQVIEKKTSILSSKEIVLDVRLGKPLYNVNEKVVVYISIKNNSSKAIKSIRLAVRQHASLQDTNGSEHINTKCNLSELVSTQDCPIKPGGNVAHKYELNLLDDSRRNEPQIAMDGQLHDEDTMLATSTQVNPNAKQSDVRGGIHVDYEVKVKLQTGLLGPEVSCRVPFFVSRPRKDLHSVVKSILETGEEDQTPLFDEPDVMNTELVFEDFIQGRAEKFFNELANTQ